jgi:hypothetical protein
MHIHVVFKEYVIIYQRTLHMCAYDLCALVMCFCLFTAFLTKYYLSDQIKKNEMGGRCSMYGGQDRFIQGFGGKL